MKIIVGNYTVEFKEKLTYGEFEKVQDALMSAKIDTESSKLNLSLSDMKTMQQKILEVAIINITDETGKNIQYDINFLRSLDMDDANDLLEQISSIINTKKK